MPSILPGSDPRQKPIRGRRSLEGTLCLALSLALLGLETARGQTPAPEPLGEEECVQLALAHAPFRELSEAEAGIAGAAARQAGRWPSPELSVAREPAFEAGASEHSYVLSQSIDLAGRLRLARDAARERLAASQGQIAGWRRERAAEARRRFFEVLRSERRVASLERHVQRLDRLVRLIEARAAGGDASGYDRRRMQREHAHATLRAASEQSALDRARAALGALVPVAPLWVAGTLLPSAPLPPLESLLAGLERLGEIRASDAELAALALEERAAARWWLPELSIGAGYKRSVLPDDSRAGFLVTASVSLPLWGAGRTGSQLARSRRERESAERGLALDELRAELVGHWQEAERLAAAAQAFREEIDREAHDFEHSAEAGYQGGEIGVWELLDAHRTALDTELQAIEIEALARRARVELQRLTGEPR